MTHLQLVFDHWFEKAGGGFASPTNFNPASLADRYLEVFDRLTVVGRCRGARPGEVITAHLDDGRRVDLHVVTTRGGPVGALRGAMRLLTAVAASRHRSSALLLVGPGMLGVLAAAFARLCSRSYGVEVIGNPREALTAAGLAHPWPALIGRLAARVIGDAVAAAYVTEAALQRHYPPHRTAVTATYSSIELPRSRLESTLAVARSDGGPESTGTAPEPWNLCAVATLSQPYKGIDVLVRAVAELRDAGRDVRLTIVGGGRLLPRYQQLAAGLGVAAHVEFVGQVQGPTAVDPYLRSSDLYVHPSLTEGLPRAVIEAMAAGLPCVATNVGGVPDLLSAPFLCAAGDAAALARTIAWAMDHPDACRAQVRDNREKALEFTLERLRPRRNAFYRELAAVGTDASTRS